MWSMADRRQGVAALTTIAKDQIALRDKVGAVTVVSASGRGPAMLRLENGKTLLPVLSLAHVAAWWCARVCILQMKILDAGSAPARPVLDLDVKQTAIIVRRWGGGLGGG